MKTLVVGAGATGGYLGVHLIRAGRDVTFLARPRTLSRLTADGVRIQGRDGLSTTPVNAIATADLDGPYDVVLLAVRSDAVESATDDFRAAVGVHTRIVPMTNGMAHLSTLAKAFGEDAVLGATAKLATSLLPDGTIDEVVPGAQLEIGSLDGSQSDDISSMAKEFAVDGISVRTTNTVRVAMWEKFAFITTTAVLTCLAGDVIGPIARASGGTTLAVRILDEVDSVATAEGYPLSRPAKEALHGLLTDPTSSFGPSMFRDLRAGRPVETSVFSDLTARARHHDIAIPLVDAATVVIDVRGR
ncbi:ketopantoate reductase family protein [Mycobacterium antarcticum]|uniref:ketopantoate reductase family protein n=1 Tax=Mycolicibacterium sp. TUM20985 TaxID=3023370 RepID=UPI00257293EF|nr:2-dehydropantoate 2-reductase [Mycolicibacterium sp. TUM20985]